MKLIKNIFFPLLCLLILPALASCNDEKDETPTVGKNIAGTYNGALSWKVMTYEGEFPGKYEVAILEDADHEDCVNVILPACSFKMPIPGSTAETPIPSLTVKGVPVKESANVYSFSMDEFTITIDGVAYKGSKLAGSVVGKDVTLAYELTPGRMPMVINFSFNGTLK